jgi:hypothetical protein
MRKRGVLILEILDKSDPGSEGMFLAHMLRLMRVEHQYVEVRTKQQFLALLGTSPFRIIHITTHGAVIEELRRGRERKRFAGLCVGDGEVELEDLDRLKGKLGGCTLVTTACLAGGEKFARAIVKTTGCEYYIGPRRSPWHRSAIFFSHIFYHKLFVLKRTIRDILTEYDQRYRNPHKFAGMPVKKYVEKTVK